MKWRLSNNGTIKLSDEAIQKIKFYIQDKNDSLEAGGVLLGRFIIESKNIVIDDVTVPQPEDKRERYSFERNEKAHQKIITARWNFSKKTCNYLGGWHTHPENDPEPSSLDITGWKKHLKEDVFSSRYLYFIICGIKQIHIWEGDRRNLKIKKLKLGE